ncbi:phosphatidylinositol-3-phosphatase SAC1 [Condylostylus longicornis]|uniref:phosphatidylinositol-3-phosphatase SAC1 n=1 Tax=Condylostylus longicornis TaxID=2530218 RepID=UPI00244E3DCE|nr:phosphatidylinositol-3-phosphatase SAC1 [Condylostylus longicornis]
MDYVYNDMNLYITNEKFYIQPNGKSEALVIDRQTPEVKVQKECDLKPLLAAKRVCGVLGTIKLISGRYLIVATHRIFVGLINGQVIWRLAGYDIIPYIPTTMHLTQQQKLQNEKYFEMLKKVLDTPFLYFSYSYDLTHTLQRLHSIPPDLFMSGLLDSADHRFVWNNYLLRNFNCSEMKAFALPIVLGFISINQANVNGYPFQWIIISRRSNERAGTRLFCRGCNDEGQCANYVETEQIIEFAGQKISFVQTRGSIPLFWRQTPNLKLKPPPEIIAGKDHLSAFTKHFDAQIMLYGRQVLVNLIDQKGREAALEKAYKNLVELLGSDSIRYEAFDFHAECKKMRWDRLNILIDRLAHEQNEFGYFHLGSDGQLYSSQDGVFRVNCIDCLDRTNVVQSMLARRSLNIVLKKLGVLQYEQNFENVSPAFEVLFKAVWADNADLISVQYSGTGALKTDFTRTGKRTKAGLIKDGTNSLTRYVLNNFYDGFRQDALDLFLGNYMIRDNEGTLIPSPLIAPKGWRYGTFPSVLMFALAMFFASAIFPKEYKTENLLFLMFWGAMIGVSTTGIMKYGTEFVNWPKLQPLSSKMDA